MSRILICTMLAAVLSGESAAITSPTTRPIHAISTGLAARAGPDEASPLPRGQFGWPLPGSPTVVRAFYPPEFPFGPGHRGVDLAAQAGAPVLAAGAGTVVFAGMVAGRGVMSVSHPGGLRTTYEPVAATVVNGDQVSRGERIGTVQPGHLGCPVTVCLHWGAFRGPAHTRPDQVREYLNPLLLIFGMRVRLLPIDGPPDRHDTCHPRQC
ncbi:MAG: M23 family metallopeptidase [Pseudonocardiaceae bacterium]